MFAVLVTDPGFASLGKCVGTRKEYDAAQRLALKKAPDGAGVVIYDARANDFDFHYALGGELEEA